MLVIAFLLQDKNIRFLSVCLFEAIDVQKLCSLQQFIFSNKMTPVIEASVYLLNF